MADIQNNKDATVARFYCTMISLTFIIGLVPFAFNVVVDPYEMNQMVDSGIDKKKISEKAHYPLWKMAHYPARLPEIIVLGDSRARSLRDKYWHELGLPGTYNFAYGGATLHEIYDTFKFVKNNKQLKTLVVGIQLRSFDPDHKGGMNRVPEAIRLTRNPLKYYSNWFVSRIGVKLLEKEYGPRISRVAGLGLISPAHAQAVAKDAVDPLKGLLDPEICENCMLPKNVTPSLHPTFFVTRGHHFSNDLGIWQRLWQPLPIERELGGKFKTQISRNAKSDWRSFNFSEELWSYLTEISAWSKQANVQLIFIIPPTITEMQNSIVKFGFGELNHNFRKRLTGLGMVVDFDFDNQLTRDLERFTDAYHSNYKVARLIVGEISQLTSFDQRVVTKARKRRKDIICPILQEDVSNRIANEFMEVLEGKSCRIWRARRG